MNEMTTKTELKKLWRVFILVFLVSFLIINWNDVSWIFNLRTVSRILTGFFQKENKNTLSSHQEFGKENGIEIPKIEISAPLIFVAEENDVLKNLDRGVVHFPDSVLPSEIGQTIILGHSAPPDWPKIKYDWVFSRINELEKGDEILIYFNNQRYSYSVTKKTFLEKEEQFPENGLTDFQNMLVLISCWPPGKDIKRIAVEATLN